MFGCLLSACLLFVHCSVFNDCLLFVCYFLLFMYLFFIIHLFCIICLFSKKNIKGYNRYLSSSTPNSNNFNFNYNRYKWYGLLHMYLLMIISEIFNFKSILFIYILITIMYLLYLLLDFYILRFRVRGWIRWWTWLTRSR